MGAIGAVDAWDRFTKSGDVRDYLEYRKKMAESSGVIGSGRADIFGARNEESVEGNNNPRDGLWGK